MSTHKEAKVYCNQCGLYLYSQDGNRDLGVDCKDFKNNKCKIHDARNSFSSNKRRSSRKG